ALFTRISMGPSFAIFSTRAGMSFSLFRSKSIGIALGPNSVQACSVLSLVLPMMYVLIPLSQNFFAVAYPRPEFASVTMALLVILIFFLLIIHFLLQS